MAATFIFYKKRLYKPILLEYNFYGTSFLVAGKKQIQKEVIIQ
ncbi:hypothetical protein FTV88_0285 [Heliorestis convoluta]|uniref:Uncharacterized protein n=1 Tax=Heliorestis convoluta TaxID=356322 RepID=A0A5Q2MVY4_9FIRM|nr:hypothetical protein FTV88_0285 [Heliorestis convoluta]